MTSAIIGYLGICGVVLLLMLRIPIAAAMGVTGSIGMFVIYSLHPILGFRPWNGFSSVSALMISVPYDFLNSYSLAAIPLFILMGLVAHSAGMTTDLYDSARKAMRRIPGGLAVATIMGCGGFAAITGSSIACAATLGRISVPQMLSRNYSPALAASCVALGGTLGALIPPSVMLILYGLFTETSVGTLFIAVLVPGILSMIAYIAVVMIWVTLVPSAAPRADMEEIEALRSSSRRSWPVLLVFALTIGGIYVGVFTATEAAAFGAAAILLLAAATRRLAVASAIDNFTEACRQSAYLFLIAIGGKLFVAFVALSGVASDLAAVVQNADLSAGTIMFLIVMAYLVMGMILDPLGILLLSLPLVIPIVDAQGFNLIWFGVIVVKLIEIGLVTPPVGLNVFVINSVIGNRVPLLTIFKGVAFFLIAEIPLMTLLILFPAITLWLPSLMR